MIIRAVSLSKNAINIKDHVTSPVTKRKNTYSINDQPRCGFDIFIVSSLTVSLLNKTSGFQSFAFLTFYWFCDPTDASAVLDFSILHKNRLVDHHWNFILLLSFALGLQYALFGHKSRIKSGRD